MEKIYNKSYCKLNGKEIMRVFPFFIKMGRKKSFSFPILPGKGIPAELCRIPPSPDILVSR